MLSIITITYNNLDGLKRTEVSIRNQIYKDYEWIIVDGDSKDGTKEYLTKSSAQWISGPDKGVYDAQNKGVEMAKGEYLFFLNAGDCFTAPDVLQRMMTNAQADIVYGNEIVVDDKGTAIGMARGVDKPTYIDLYNSCMKHQASFIRKSLFTKYGVYDADMRIVADFEWFFRVIALHRKEVTLEYRNVDVSYFENTGISYHNPEICRKERAIVLNRYVPKWKQTICNLLSLHPRVWRKIVHLLMT